MEELRTIARNETTEETALIVERKELDVLCARGGRCHGIVVVRNGGERPLEVSASTDDAWLRVRGGGTVEAGASVLLEVDVDAAAVPAERVLHQRRGDRFAVGSVRIESNGGRAELQVRSWQVGPVDGRALGFGGVAGFIPFINLLMASVLVCDTVAKRRARGESIYRRHSELRENACFLAGLVPGVIAHVALFLAAM